jgi:hypothetical protein
MKELTAFRKFLAEGKIIKEEVEFDLEAWSNGKDFDGPMLDADLMFFADKDEFKNTLLTTPEELGYKPEDIEFIKDRFVGQDKISTKEFIKRHDEFWEIYGDYGGDTDSIIDGFNANIKKGVLTPEEAGIAYLMYTGEIDPDAAADILDTFK